MSKYLTRLISLILSLNLILEQSVFAQAIDLSRYLSNPVKPALQSDKFRPLHLRSLGYDNLSQDFKLFLDKGDTKKEELENKTYLEENTQTLLKYFFIGLTLPNDKFWVNLRPDSPDNILDPDLEKTDIGRIFLEADLQLKKDTSGMTSPQTKEGREYWDKLYKKARELFGSENITIPTITRPWIVPNEIIIREAPDNAYIYKATLKVMLEEDYLNQKTEKPKNQKTEIYNFSDPRLKELNEYSTKLIKETIIPKLTYEINTSRRYAHLRQVYYSLILAQWFKQKYGSSGSIRAPGSSAPVNNYVDLIDSGNLVNLASKEPYDKQIYFQQYQKSFKDGEYNLQEPVYTSVGQSVRRYVSGGIKFYSLAAEVIKSDFKDVPQALYLKDVVYPFGSSPLNKKDNASLVSLLRDPLNASKDLRGKARKVIKEGNAIKEFLGVRDITDIAYEIKQSDDSTGGYVLKFIADTENGEMSFYAKLRHSSGAVKKIIKWMWPEKIIEITRADPDGDWAFYKVEGYGNNEFRASRANPTTLEYKMTVEASQEGIAPQSCIIADSLIIRGVDNGMSLEDIFYGDGRNKSWSKFFLDNKEELVTKIGKAYGTLNKKLNIEHGDIKLEHIFITSDKKIYLIDFTVREPGEGGLLSRRTSIMRGNSDLERLISAFSRHDAKDLYKQWLKKGYEEVSSAVEEKPSGRENHRWTFNAIRGLPEFNHIDSAVAIKLDKSIVERIKNGRRPTILVVGVGRGKLPFDLLKKYGINALDIYSLNLEDESMLFTPKELSREAQIEEEAATHYLDRIRKAPAPSESARYISHDLRNGLPEFGVKFDIIIIPNEVLRYIPDCLLKVVSPLVRKALAPQGELFAAINNVALTGNTANTGIRDILRKIQGWEVSPDYPTALSGLKNKLNIKPDVFYRYNHFILYANKDKNPEHLEEYLSYKKPFHSFPDDGINPIIYLQKNASSSVTKDSFLNKSQSASRNQESEIETIEAMLERHGVDPDLLNRIPDFVYGKIFFTERGKDLLNDDDHKKLFDFLWSRNKLPEELKAGLKKTLKEEIIKNRKELDSVMGSIVEGNISNTVLILLKKALKDKFSEDTDVWSYLDSIASFQNKKGGIAFNALPIQTESVASSALGALSMGRAFKGDLDEEWGKMQSIFNAGVRPSIQRLGEYTAAAVASPLAEDKIDQVRVMLADILRRDEESEKLAPAEESCKQLLRALESA